MGPRSLSRAGGVAPAGATASTGRPGTSAKATLAHVTATSASVRRPAGRGGVAPEPMLERARTARL